MQNSLTLSEDVVNEKIKNGDPYVIRVKIPRNEEVRFEDIIRGWVTVNTSNLDDKVLFKSDGMPTYHLANIVDDHLMEITHVIRGEEWLPSAPLHVLLYQYLGWSETMPKLAHLPLILKPDGNGKLSKRDGDRLGFPVFPLNWIDDVSGEESSGYKERGYFTDAFNNMLAFLGWNPGTNEELFNLPQLVDAFTLERVGKSGAKFDAQKALWFQQQYLRSTENDKLAEIVAPIAEELNIETSLEKLSKICGLMKERATFSKDILTEGIYFYQAPTEYDPKTLKKKWKDHTPLILSELKQDFENIENFNQEEIETVFSSFLEKKEIGFGQIGPALRLAISGKGMGPSLFEICEILGKAESIQRIDTALNTIKK
jgi:glutamyl-tRNA synthetase